MVLWSIGIGIAMEALCYLGGFQGGCHHSSQMCALLRIGMGVVCVFAVQLCCVGCSDVIESGVCAYR